LSGGLKRLRSGANATACQIYETYRQDKSLKSLARPKGFDRLAPAFRGRRREFSQVVFSLLAIDIVGVNIDFLSIAQGRFKVGLPS
jgi:hypothetical protein